MNRLIVLDNLRHGWVRLLMIGAACVAMFSMADLLLKTGASSTAAMCFGAQTMLAVVWVPPSPTPVRVDMLLESLLPISRRELVNTQWLLRAILPAAWLTMFFLIAWLLGLADQLGSVMPWYLPVHLFAAYLSGTSLYFLATVALRQASPGNPQPLGGLLAFVAMAAPVAYLAALFAWRDHQGIEFVLILFALVFAAIARHIACSKLLLPMSRRPSPPSSWRKHRIGRDSRSGGFMQFARTLLRFQLAMVTAVLFGMVVVQWLARGMGSAEEHLYPLRELIRLTLPIALVLARFAIDTQMMVGRECRILRILPFSSGSLAVLILAATSGTLALGMVLLSPVACFVYGIEAGAFILTVSFCVIGFTSLATPLRLMSFPLYFEAPALFMFVFILMKICSFFYDGFTEGSPIPLALAGMIALLPLVLSWWSLKRLLTHSSQVYRPSVPRLFSLAESH